VVTVLNIHRQATGSKDNLRTAFFWVITQRVVAISYRRFGTTYRSSTL